MANFLIQGQTTQTVLVRLVPLKTHPSSCGHILTKFGDDWLIFVDARMLTSKLWTDGQTDGQRWTVSDHNSSLSTPCSGEHKNAYKCGRRGMQNKYVHIFLTKCKLQSTVYYKSRTRSQTPTFS